MAPGRAARCCREPRGLRNEGWELRHAFGYAPGQTLRSENAERQAVPTEMRSSMAATRRKQISGRRKLVAMLAAMKALAASVSSRRHLLRISLLAPQEDQHLRCPGRSTARHQGSRRRIWRVSFMHLDLGYFDLEQKTLQPLDNPFGTRLSPMSQVHSVLGTFRYPCLRAGHRFARQEKEAMPSRSGGHCQPHQRRSMRCYRVAGVPS
jgi:hypothetical protein